MATSMETIHQDLIVLKKDIDFIKHIVSEDFELSGYAKSDLKEARETPESEYADLE